MSEGGTMSIPIHCSAETPALLVKLKYLYNKRGESESKEPIQMSDLCLAGWCAIRMASNYVSSVIAKSTRPNTGLHWI